MTIVCSSLVFGAVTRLCSSGLGFFLTHLGVIPEGLNTDVGSVPPTSFYAASALPPYTASG